MQVKGKVVSVELDTEIQKKDGGTYPGARLTYRASDGKIAEQAWHQNGLKYNASVRNTLNELKEGMDFTMIKEKNDAGFWNVTSMSIGASAPAQDSSPAKATPTGRSGNNNNGVGDKERQVMIIRQSSIANAVNMIAASGKKADATTEKVLAVAADFEKWVLTGKMPAVLKETKTTSADTDSGVE